jgi:hypothetical protein
MSTMAKLILESLPVDASLVRIHISGDFFSQAYFDAWLMVARLKPNTTFYAYTKSVNYWIARSGLIPDNFKLNASLGGRFDEYAEAHNLKTARIVLSEDEAANLGLEIDHDDSHAWKQEASFALLVHGTQSPGSAASKSWTKQLAVIKAANKALPPKQKRLVAPPTVASLTAQIVRLATRLAGILTTPIYKVQRA